MRELFSDIPTISMLIELVYKLLILFFCTASFRVSLLNIVSSIAWIENGEEIALAQFLSNRYVHHDLSTHSVLHFLARFMNLSNRLFISHFFLIVFECHIAEMNHIWVCSHYYYRLQQSNTIFCNIRWIRIEAEIKLRKWGSLGN